MNNSVVIVPTYNEITNIEELTTQILSLNQGLDILLIDDNSPDGTGRLLDILSSKSLEIKVIHRQKKLGLASAYLEGFRKALREGYEYMVYMDGDFSHSPKDIPRYLDKIKDYDLVIGSRFLKGINIMNWSLFRLLLSIFANKYVKFVTRLPFSDCTGGFKCFRKEVVRHIVNNGVISKGYIFQTEVLYRAYNMGYRVGELSIYFIDRKIGDSKLSPGIVLEAIFKVLILRFKNYKK